LLAKNGNMRISSSNASPPAPKRAISDEMMGMDIGMNLVEKWSFYDERNPMKSQWRN